MAQRAVFITGASSGLGRGLALHYAREGWTVHAVARREAELQSLEVEAGAAPGHLIPVVLDVTQTEALVAAIRAAEKANGGALDLVIANAGGGAPQAGAKLEWQKVAAQLDLNVTAACVTLAAALPAMVARGSGTLVGMASLAGLRGLPTSAAYSAAKAALSVFLESLRVDLKGTGVKALCIYPGFVRTPATAKNKNPMPFLMDVDQAVKIMARGIEQGRGRILYPWPTATFMRLLSSMPASLYELFAGAAKGVVKG